MRHSNEGSGFSFGSLLKGFDEQLAALGELPKGEVRTFPLVCHPGALTIRVVMAGGAIWRFTAMLCLTKRGKEVLSRSRNADGIWQREEYFRRRDKAISINPEHGQYCAFEGIPHDAKLARLEIMPGRLGDTAEMVFRIDGGEPFTGAPEFHNGDDVEGGRALEKGLEALIQEKVEMAKTAEAMAAMRGNKTPRHRPSTGEKMRRHHGMPMGLVAEQDAPFNDMVREQMSYQDMFKEENQAAEARASMLPPPPVLESAPVAPVQVVEDLIPEIPEITLQLLAVGSTSDELEEEPADESWLDTM